MVIFDGSLYNRTALAQELAVSSTAASEEIVKEAYNRWGKDCLTRLDGAFAFVVHKKEEVFMARDAMGLKRLFYTTENPALAYAFEINALPIKPRINREGIAEILLLGPGRTPGTGIFEGVHELLPGEWVMHSPAGLKRGIYWKPEAKPHPHSFEETTATVREMLISTVKRQAASKETVCAFLSGGLDSSALAALSGVKETFSVDYTGNAEHFTPNAFQPDDDRAFIACMTEFLGTRHTNITLETDELADALYDAAKARGFPGMGDVDASLLLFCRRVREHARVAFSGEGADEIFGGYPWYRDQTRLWEDGFPWSQSIAYKADFAKHGIWDGLDPEEYVRERYKKAIADADCLSTDTLLEKRMRQMFMLNIGWFGQTLLERHDRMSRHAGLEVRMPFCDRLLVEYLYNVPWEFKNYHGREKGLLREALKDLLPKEVLWRKKSPYPKTFNPAYWDRVSAMMQELLQSPNEPIFDIIEKNKVKQLLENTNDGPPWYGQLMTKPQTVAYFLQINGWLKEYKAVYTHI